MVRIEVIIVLLTPFHKKAILNLFPQEFLKSQTLLFHTEIVDVSDFNCNKIKLKDYDFSKRKIFSEPLKYLRAFRKNIKQIKKEVDFLNFKKYQISENLKIYLGNDKDIFTQILLNRLKNKAKNVIAIDEGFGFYALKKRTDVVFQIIYSIFTPLLFSERLYHIRRLGTHPQITKVYLRSLNLLPQNNKKVIYEQFNFTRSQIIKEIPKGKILLFSFAEQHYFYNTNSKIKLYQDIAGYLNEHNRELIIKPHPRENIEDLYKEMKLFNNSIILPKDIVGESLNYFDYEYIINIFSSVILDILDNKYPKNRIYTIAIYKQPEIEFDKSMFYAHIDNFDIKKILNFEN